MKDFWIVTGARGAIGRAVARHAEASDRMVTAVSRTSDGECVDWDTLWTTNELERGGTLVHCAWSTVPALSEAKPGVEREADLPLLERVMRRLGSSRGKWRFVFLSSGGAVYGECHDAPREESDPCEPIGWHGRMKLEAERLLERRAAENGVDLVVVRPSNVYGFDVSEARPQGLIPHAIHAAREGRPLSLWGDGSAIKDYVHVSDVVNGILALADARVAGTFNICSGGSVSVRELLAQVESATGRAIAVETTPRREWDVQASRLSHARLTAATGWMPRVSLREGIERTIADLKG